MPYQETNDDDVLKYVQSYYAVIGERGNEGTVIVAEGDRLSTLRQHASEEDRMYEWSGRDWIPAGQHCF